jgi:hypothetical protein
MKKNKKRIERNTLCVDTVSGMVTCRLVIRCLVLNYNLDSCKITNNSSGVPTTPTSMSKSDLNRFSEEYL